MPDPKPRRRWGRALLVVAATVTPLASVLYAADLPRVRPALDRFWRWFDGSLERLQVMSWVVAAIVAAVTYCSYLADKRSKLLEQARWAVDRATEGKPEAQQRVGRQAIADLQHSAEESGEQLPGFVDTAHTVTDTFKKDILTAAGKDPAAVEEIESEAQHGEFGTVDGTQEGER
ncbi:hypothetical protein ACH9D2_08220 [Kocuria sp. M4R2S49]|uniref:hypothetical protein n=1 Tax=Kocuria rhizosphaericola TaxID=3376284 RepID=UPI0037B9A333